MSRRDDSPGEDRFRIRLGKPKQRGDAFIAQVFAQARILSVRIAELWEFPESVTNAIEHAGVDAHADADPQAQALALGDRLSKLRMLVDTGRFPADDPFVMAGLGKSQMLVFDKLADEDEDEDEDEDDEE